MKKIIKLNGWLERHLACAIVIGVVFVIVALVALMARLAIPK